MSKRLVCASVALTAFAWTAAPAAQGAPPAQPEVPITSIDISQSDRGDEANAIDNNEATFSYLTASGTSGFATAFLGFDAAADVGQLRFIKQFQDTDAVASTDPDHLDLTILYTTDPVATPLASRTYTPVTGLSASTGEPMSGPVAGATITDQNNPAGAYTLTFDAIPNATALGFQFGPGATDPNAPVFTHYPTAEFQAFAPVPEPTTLGLLALAGAATLGRRRRRVG